MQTRAGHPARSYAEAEERVAAMKARDTEEVHPGAWLRFLTHGERTARAIVLLHGITSSPAQFAQLGERCYERGQNVLIPRMPRMGLRDRLTRAQAGLTRGELLAYAHEAVDAGRGLGSHLTVAGLSVAGTLAGWCAQLRADIDLAVPIAPALAPSGVPTTLVRPLGHLALRLPNFFVWWNWKERERYGPPYVYPWYATHAMAHGFLLGDALLRAARERGPLTRSILVVTNARDRSVSNRATSGLVEAWRRHRAEGVQSFTFGEEAPPTHDIISPHKAGQRTEVVYPILLDLLDQHA